MDTIPWFSRATRFGGLGRAGDELNGSKAGNRDAGRFAPAKEATEALLWIGDDDSIVVYGDCTSQVGSSVLVEGDSRRKEGRRQDDTL